MARIDRSMGTKPYSNHPRPVKPAPSPWPGRLVRLVIGASGILLAMTVVWAVTRLGHAYLVTRGYLP